MSEPARDGAGAPRRLTPSDIEIRPLYEPSPAAAQGFGESVGKPGAFPFTRGIHPTMYRGRLWTMRQYAGFSSAEETNKRFRYLLERGQTGLSVAFDLPTQLGYDPDHPLSEGEVGKVGVSIASLDDVAALFEGIPLENVSVSMTINSTAAILLAMVVALAKRRGTPLEALSGTVQNDILKEYAARGTYRFPVGPSLRLVTDVFEFGKESLPKWNTISVSGYHMREAGCTAVQEVAFTLANGIAYLEAARARSLHVDDVAPRLSFFFNAHNDLFEEVAKFRAARRIWARTVRERFSSAKEESQKLRFHTQTAGSTLTSQQPDVNVVRVTLQALAAVLGGTQSLHTNSRDEALSLPTESAALLALRTQQVIAHESGVAATADPLGGSPFVEALTDEVESRARELMAKIDAMGGAVKAIERGFVQQEIHRSAYRWQKEVEEGRRTVVGVNAFRLEDEAAAPAIFSVPASVGAARRSAVEAVRRSRDAAAARRALGDLASAARSERENLVPRLVACVEARLTVGEICGELEGIFGLHREANIL